MTSYSLTDLQLHFINNDFVAYLIEHCEYDDDMINSFLEYAVASLKSGNSIPGHMVTSDREYFPEIPGILRYAK